jgi:hypothetical protein
MCMYWARWNKFDSSFLNRAVEDNPEDYRKGNYVPEHEAAKIAAGGPLCVPGLELGQTLPSAECDV